MNFNFKEFVLKLLALIFKPQPQPEPPVPIPPPQPSVPSNRELLLKIAVQSLGKDVSPSDIADDELGCAESITNIIKRVYPSFKITISTALLFDYLKKDARFRGTLDLKPGNIIISVTGTGNGTIPHGHCGIIGEAGVIMSNDSATGLWKRNYTTSEWIERFRKKGGMPVYVFEPL